MSMLPQRDPTVKMRFHEYCVILKHDGSLVLEDFNADALDIGNGDGFMAFVDPVTREVTLQKIDLAAVEQIEGTLPILEEA